MNIRILIEKIFRAMFGFSLYGLGISMTINANQGLAPWGVFHQGLSLQLGITMGTATQIVGAVIVLIDIFFGERVGWGTVGNVVFIGFFIDLIANLGFLPQFENIGLNYLMMTAGMVIISLATYFYLSARMGAGPRDGMMIALTKRTKFKVGLIRNAIEIFVLIVGFLLGGKVGFGTLIMALGLGRFIQIVFNIFKFDVRQVKHRYIDDDIKAIMQKLTAPK